MNDTAVTNDMNPSLAISTVRRRVGCNLLLFLARHARLQFLPKILAFRRQAA